MVVVSVVVVRMQNILSPAARDSGTRDSGSRGSGTKVKFSKSSRAWKWYERKIFKVQPRLVMVRVVVVRTQIF